VIDKQAIEAALKAVGDVYGNGDIVENRRVERIAVDAGTVALTLNLPTDDAEVKRRVEDEARAAIKALQGVREVMIMTRGEKPTLAAAGPAQGPAQGGQQGAQQGGPGPSPGGNPFDQQSPIEGVNNIIAVSSAKGGVGKSTVCVNLALAMARQGARVGVMDADVYGPSVHILLGIEKRPQAGETKEIAPVEAAGLKVMSLGLLTDQTEAVIWRGPIVMGVVKKFLHDVEWGELDYLFIDMPPGTGDAQLTLAQTVPVTGAVIVTTPSKLALVDAEKGLHMFRRVEIPVLGFVENMSHFMCPHCGERTDIFNHSPARETAERLDTVMLGELPLDPAVRASGDEGRPTVQSAPDSPVGRGFLDIAGRLRELVPAAGTKR